MLQLLLFVLESSHLAFILFPFFLQVPHNLLYACNLVAGPLALGFEAFPHFLLSFLFFPVLFSALLQFFFHLLQFNTLLFYLSLQLVYFLLLLSRLIEDIVLLFCKHGQHFVLLFSHLKPLLF